MTNRQTSWRSWRRVVGAGALALGVGAMGACDDVLDVDLPSDVSIEKLNDPSLANTLALGAQADFECAFVIYILDAGTWADEIIDSSTWASPRGYQLRQPAEDSGNGDCPTITFRDGGMYGVYGHLQIARGQAITASTLISGFTGVANQAQLVATAKAYEGYATLLLGEAYCEMRLDPEGDIITPDATLQAAADRFNEAITGAGTNTQVLNLARVGRARALTRLGGTANTTAAAALVAPVPQTFVYNATYAASPTRRVNWLRVYNVTHNHISFDESFRNLTVGGVADTRVPLVDRTAGATRLVPNDGVTPMFEQRLYTSEAAPIPMATWREAQLIQAEAELDQNDAAGAVAFIDAVRAHAGLPLYAVDPGTAVTVPNVRAQLLEERRRTLFLQGHRLGDLLAYNLPFRWAGQTDHKGRAVTTNTCWRLPDDELQG